MTAPFWPSNTGRLTATLGDLIILWRGDDQGAPPSSDWLRRRPAVQARYSLWLNKFAALWGSTPLQHFDERTAHSQIRDLRNQLQTTRRKADEFVRVLNVLFEFGRTTGLLRRNPAAGIKQLGTARSYADVFWTEEDLDRFHRKARELGQPAVIDFVELIACTGMGVKEAINLTYDDVTEYYAFRPDTSDKGRPRRGLPAYPLTTEARALLDKLEVRPRQWGVKHILVDSNGAPWGRAWVLGKAKKIRDAAQIVHVDLANDASVTRKKDIKDLTKTWAIRAMRAGATDDDIIMLRRWKRDDVADLRLLAELGEHIDPNELDRLSWASSLT